MDRCSNQLCGNLISRRREPIRLGDRVFCSYVCQEDWIVQSKAFDTAAHRFHEPQQPSKR